MASSRPFIVGPSDTRIEADAHAIADVAAAFARDRAFACRGVIAPPLVATLSRIARASTFTSDPIDGVGHRRIETPSRAGAALTLALSRPVLLRWIESVTGCAPLGSVSGRVVETRAATDDHLMWHDDLNDRRRCLAIIVNLSERPFEGGAFELRAAGSTTRLVSYQHSEVGSALIFDVAPGLEHRVLPVTAGGPRRVYAGWFLRAGAVPASPA